MCSRGRTQIVTRNLHLLSELAGPRNLTSYSKVASISWGTVWDSSGHTLVQLHLGSLLSDSMSVAQAWSPFLFKALQVSLEHSWGWYSSVSSDLSTESLSSVCSVHPQGWETGNSLSSRSPLTSFTVTANGFSRIFFLQCRGKGLNYYCDPKLGFSFSFFGQLDTR